MIELIKESNPKSNKVHVCDLCLGDIKKNEVYCNQTNIIEGEICTHKSHMECGHIVFMLDMHKNIDGEYLTSEGFCDEIDTYCNTDEYKNESTHDKVLTIYEMD